MTNSPSLFTHGGKAPSPEIQKEKEKEKKGICVAIGQEKKQFAKQFIDTPEECFSLLKDAKVAWASFGVGNFYTEGQAIASAFGFGDEIVRRLLSDDKSHYYDFNTELGLRLPSVQIDELDVLVIPLAIFIRDGFILTIHSGDSRRLVKFARYVDSFMRKIPARFSRHDQLTILLTRLINENTDRNFDYLRDIEEKGDQMSATLVESKIDRQIIGKRIYLLKHALIVFLDTLWTTLDVVNSLRYGDPDVLSDRKDLLRQIGVLAEEINRQIQLAEHMSEVLISGLEVLQSIYNNQLQELNNRMALTMTWLTVIGTAVLVPNTLATILSGSAFELTRQDAWWYLLLLLVSTVASTWFAYWWVNVKVRLPSRINDQSHQNQHEK